MAKSVNGKPGGTVAESTVNTVYGRLTIAQALELSVGQIRWRRRLAESFKRGGIAAKCRTVRQRKDRSSD